MRILIPAVLLASLLGVWALPAQQEELQTNGKNAPRNLQVLKTRNIGPTMLWFDTALGQRCEFCHAPGPDRWSDANPKKGIARQMIVMTNEINQKLSSGQAQVTCWTCHRGHNKPQSEPPPPHE